MCDLRSPIFDLRPVSAAAERRDGECRDASDIARRTSHGAFGGFTLTELLVVIGIMVLLMAIGTVGYRAMFTGRRTDAAINAVSAAAGATRAFVGRDRAFLVGQPSGVALVFTPANEIRITENVWYARNTSDHYLEDSDRNGYADIRDMPYFEIPKGVGFVAIMRNTPGAARFYAPPFAVRFDQDGHLVSGQNDHRLVYYDGNYNDNWQTSSTRPADYDPAPYNPDEDAAYNNGELIHWHEDEGKMELPFEELETVVGVMVFDRIALKGDGHDLLAASGGVVNPGAADWIRENGAAIFFNRYTGAVVKER